MRHVAHRFVRLCVRLWHRWYDAECVVRQLELVGQLGAAIEVKGPIALSAPATVSIGDGVGINPRFRLKGAGGLTIGSHCHFGEDITVYTESHTHRSDELLPYGKERITAAVVIGNCVWIGDRVLIMPGVTIGDGAILGAGAIVTKSIEPGSIVAGSPAREVGRRDWYAFQRLLREGKFLGWPRRKDRINGRWMIVRRALPRAAAGSSCLPQEVEASPREAAVAANAFDPSSEDFSHI
jgi:acetyltransferase-like isoleucine patch superfamily enzyme